MKLAIGLLLAHGFPAPSEFWFSYERLKEAMRTGRGHAGLPEHLQVTDLRVFQTTAFPIDVARNGVCASVLEQGYDYLFFADCDHVFPEDTITRLLAHDVALVSARYHMRKEPYHAVAYVKHKTQDGPHVYAPVHYGQGLIEIERGGAGALLIRRDVLEAIHATEGHNWFRYQRGPDAPHDFTVSEDFWFWRKAREAGFTGYMDWEVEVGHLQTFAINRSWNQAYLDAQVRAFSDMTTEERQQALDSLIVCGYPEGIRLASGDHIPPYTYSPGER